MFPALEGDLGRLESEDRLKCGGVENRFAKEPRNDVLLTVSSRDIESGTERTSLNSCKENKINNSHITQLLQA